MNKRALWVFFWNGWIGGVRSTGRDVYDINAAYEAFEKELDAAIGSKKEEILGADGWDADVRSKYD
jgi:hypothetical protein